MLVLVSAVGSFADTVASDEAGREQARNIVRQQLRLERNRFLAVQRDESLEQLLTLAVGRRAEKDFIYRVSPAGDEAISSGIIHHLSVDGDPLYIIAICAANGQGFRIHGFADSDAEFEKLMVAAGVRVSSADQAEHLAGLYRAVNPESLPLTPITSLLELKQAAERDCQDTAKSFESGEGVFQIWWRTIGSRYERVPFNQEASPHGTRYIVQWVVLSSRAPGGTCAGSPLRALLELGPDGHIGKLKFSPYNANDRGK